MLLCFKVLSFCQVLGFPAQEQRNTSSNRKTKHLALAGCVGVGPSLAKRSPRFCSLEIIMFTAYSRHVINHGKGSMKAHISFLWVLLRGAGLMQIGQHACSTHALCIPCGACVRTPTSELLATGKASGPPLQCGCDAFLCCGRHGASDGCRVPPKRHSGLRS